MKVSAATDCLRPCASTVPNASSQPAASLRSPAVTRSTSPTSLTRPLWASEDRKIEATPDAPRIIKTVRGVGYVLAVDVRKY